MIRNERDIHTHIDYYIVTTECGELHMGKQTSAFHNELKSLRKQ